jgi:hypothetical protein
MVPVLNGGVFVSDKCPLCKSPTKVEIDSKSLARKVNCESCGYENIENLESTVSINEDPPRDKTPKKKKPEFANRGFRDSKKWFNLFGVSFIILQIYMGFPAFLNAWEYIGINSYDDLTHAFVNEGNRNATFEREYDRWKRAKETPVSKLPIEVAFQLCLLIIINKYSTQIKSLKADNELLGRIVGNVAAADDPSDASENSS